MKDQISKKVFLRGASENGIYTLYPPIKQAFTVDQLSIDEWHARLGHPHQYKVSKIVSQLNLPVSKSSMSSCLSCYLEKLFKVPLTSVEHKTQKPFEIIHSDVWVLSCLGHRYMVLFVNDLIHFAWIYFMKNKSEVYNIFLNFKSMITR